MGILQGKAENTGGLTSDKDNIAALCYLIPDPPNFVRYFDECCKYCRYIEVKFSLSHYIIAVKEKPDRQKERQARKLETVDSMKNLNSRNLSGIYRRRHPEKAVLQGKCAHCGYQWPGCWETVRKLPALALAFFRRRGYNIEQIQEGMVSAYE